MFRRLITIIIVILTAGPVLGQLTSADIDSLREVGQREGWTFTVGENEATRRPLEQLCGMKPSPDWREQVSFSDQSIDWVLPARFDWRELGGVTPIKNQGACGSCWAFATVAALECNVKIKDSVTIDFSEQYLLGCNQYGLGCEGGGWAAHDWHLNSAHPDCQYSILGGFGPVFESSFPYVASDVPCIYCSHEIQYCLDDWGWMMVDAETFLPETDRMKFHIMHYGPIWVCVEVTDAFEAYTSGVFNACEIMSGEPEGNHAIALVGWDDSQGEEGVFILRNSWGTTWGEGGYMRIGYGCNKLGSMGNYVDYGLPKLVYWADNRVGWAPLEVDAGASCLDAVDLWSWGFGDGGSASGQTASHTYTQRGLYDLTLGVTYSTGITRMYTKPSYVLVIADTIKAGSVAGFSGEQVVVTLTAHNTAPVSEITIPVEWPGDLNLIFDGLSLVGCRTAGFTVAWSHYDTGNQRFALRLQCGALPELAGGEGPILKLFFTIPDPSAAGQSAPILLDGYTFGSYDYFPKYRGSVADYRIEMQSGEVVSNGCCQSRGDIDHGGSVDLGDVGYFVDWTFSNDAAAPCPDEADVDGNGEVNIEDLVYLVNYLYGSGEPPPVECQ